MTTQASADLCWRLVKNNNAFILKQRQGRGTDRIVLSKEPLNMMAKSSFKYSGIVHKKAFNLNLSEKAVVVNSQKGQYTIPATKAVGVASRIGSKGRKDLRATAHRRAVRIIRLTKRTSRKSWAKVTKIEM
ncbi:60S ribosomal protein L28 [Diplonema papillatum]|nr:60S ribosomal protein L28 [Diplonema papillatum]